MRGYFLLVISVSIYLTVLGFKAFYKPRVEPLKIEDRVEYVIHADGRYWTVNPDGYLIGLADFEDMSRIAVITGVDLMETRISQKDLELMKRIEKILKNPITSEVSLNGKYVITVKGIVLYFQRWEDLLDYYDAFTDKIETLDPKSRFLLHSGGKLVDLRGD